MRIDMCRTRAVLIALLAWLASVASARAQTLSIAAASDLQAVLPTLVQRFENQSGIGARLTFGSSGNFFSQIQNGAPFDVFLSADMDYTLQHVLDGFGLGVSLF